MSGRSMPNRGIPRSTVTQAGERVKFNFKQVNLSIAAGFGAGLTLYASLLKSIEKSCSKSVQAKS